uniref:Uncharacterized protein n=1 Tax=Chrysemys picta bellii TaxID=8478 RepID=A0A8C3H774_CHRPI
MILDEKLQALQCHFTWNFEIRDKVDAAHILQTLALRIAHTHYQNQPTFLAMQAYLYHLQGQYEDALQSLREAEEILQRDHPDNFPRQATKCFQMALREDEANGEFLGGLAIAAFASWTHSHDSATWNAAREKLGTIIGEQQQNYEAKVYLAQILKRADRQQAEALLEDVVQNSLDPEVLRNAAKFFQQEFPQKAIAILQRAILLNSTYHLLQYDLGVCYKKQLKEAKSGRGEILAAAIEAFKKAVHKDPTSVFAKLALAEMYGENTPHYQEEIYLNVMSEMPSLSKRCQQAVYLHWGDFLFYKQKSLWEAAKTYKAGFAIPDKYLERQQLKTRLEEVAGEFQQSSQTAEAGAIYDFIQENESPRHYKSIGRGSQLKEELSSRCERDGCSEASWRSA